MIKKRKRIKIAGLTATVILGIALVGCGASKSEKALDSSNVTLITKVLPYGEVGYAMVCDFGEKVDASQLKPEDFKVEATLGDKTGERKVTKVYTNDKDEVSENSKDGQYVVIELDPQDELASTFGFDMEKFLNYRYDLDYSVTLKSDIKTKGGKTFKGTEDKVKNSKVVTPIVDEFAKLTYKDKSGSELNYRFFEPKKEAGKKYPLVLFLHGSGERGSDNAMHLQGNEGAVAWADPKQQEKNPAYVLAPQAVATEQLTMYWADEPNYTSVMDLLNETIQKYDVDTNRIYVVGMSNGGIGTWNIIEKDPDLFAAAVPICGMGDIRDIKVGDKYNVSKDNDIYKNIKDMPIWIFHAEDDPLVDVRYSRDAEKSIKELGGKNVKYTEYPAGTIMPMGHFSWVPALQSQEMKDWMFSQSLK
ncbi:prolyl oligopeptidase family serine peptidase [Clostridium gasigenes]|uniref:prolyl oligopeptidase family serine peptidase n=1 Tax=Clostridium gasigenes TaxID=94869 RepID=UPI001C0E474C|nr:prolyl oligopeptidase family serine peptidase [Clostridium gasigenes]MBU3138275.1 prolyl oligopeptidase family serine peptidase [Clostridium gasigenes]